MFSAPLPRSPEYSVCSAYRPTAASNSHSTPHGESHQLGCVGAPLVLAGEPLSRFDAPLAPAGEPLTPTGPPGRGPGRAQPSNRGSRYVSVPAATTRYSGISRFTVLPPVAMGSLNGRANTASNGNASS